MVVCLVGSLTKGPITQGRYEGVGSVDIEVTEAKVKVEA